jgi:hypothetical protein
MTYIEPDVDLYALMYMTEGEIEAKLLAQGLDRIETATKIRELFNRVLKMHAPYGEWCRDPLSCNLRGYCSLDPTCGD